MVDKKPVNSDFRFQIIQNKKKTNNHIDANKMHKRIMQKFDSQTTIPINTFIKIIQFSTIK